MGIAFKQVTQWSVDALLHIPACLLKVLPSQPPGNMTSRWEAEICDHIWSEWGGEKALEQRHTSEKIRPSHQIALKRMTHKRRKTIVEWTPSFWENHNNPPSTFRALRHKLTTNNVFLTYKIQGCFLFTWQTSPHMENAYPKERTVQNTIEIWQTPEWNPGDYNKIQK